VTHTFALVAYLNRPPGVQSASGRGPSTVQPVRRVTGANVRDGPSLTVAVGFLYAGEGVDEPPPPAAVLDGHGRLSQ
jgi:hypothetical protein